MELPMLVLVRGSAERRTRPSIASIAQIGRNLDDDDETRGVNAPRPGESPMAHSLPAIKRRELRMPERNCTSLRLRVKNAQNWHLLSPIEMQSLFDHLSLEHGKGEQWQRGHHCSVEML